MSYGAGRGCNTWDRKSYRMSDEEGAVLYYALL
jgi:hypothetical protein